MPLTLRQPIATPPTSPTFCAGRQFSEFEQRQLWPWRQEEPQRATRWRRERLSGDLVTAKAEIRDVAAVSGGYAERMRRRQTAEQAILNHPDAGDDD